MKTPQMRQRPLLGGPFGDGKYSLASLPTMTNGLHSVKFLVLERTGAVLATGDDKLKVLAEARRVLRLLQSVAANDANWSQEQFWPELAADVRVTTKARRVPRRRREVFARSQGHCHYCNASLSLNGKWHVEHMQPRALGGTDDPLNLVAACVECNLSKRDTSAIEFFARLTSASATPK